MSDTFKYIELFAGIGGFRHGIENIRPLQSDNAKRPDGNNDTQDKLPKWECVYSNEWNKYASQIYKKHYGECDTRDITTVPTSDIPDHDLLVGGFPCQAFSIAGKRRGFDDTRGTLFFEIARILRDKRPRYFVLENVKGLLSHDSGKTFQTILKVLTDLGYEYQWQVLNSKNFGVPQNRERVFIVGHTRGTSRPKVFPITETNGLYTKSDENKEKVHDIASTMTARQYASWNGNFLREITTGMSQGYRVYDTEGISTTLAGEAGGVGAKTGLYAMQWRRTEKGKSERRKNQAMGRDYTPFSKGFREIVPNPNKKVVGTITSQATAKDSLVGNETEIRRLTPVECERLQGFPDGWTEGGMSSIMEICVKLTDVVERLLPSGDIVLCTTKDGSVMELRNYPNGLKSDVSIVVDQPLLVNSVIDTTNRGNAMVMLYSQNEILKTDEQIKKNLILESTDGKSTKKLLNLYLEGNWNKEKLSTILTSIKETIASPTSLFARIDENIIGFIIHLKKPEPNFSNEGFLGLRMASISPISDSQRYKCLGNAVTTNVITAIVSRLLD